MIHIRINNFVLVDISGDVVVIDTGLVSGGLQLTTNVLSTLLSPNVSLSFIPVIYEPQLDI